MRDIIRTILLFVGVSALLVPLVGFFAGARIESALVIFVTGIALLLQYRLSLSLIVLMAGGVIQGLFSFSHNGLQLVAFYGIAGAVFLLQRYIVTQHYWWSTISLFFLSCGIWLGVMRLATVYAIPFSGSVIAILSAGALFLLFVKPRHIYAS